MRRFLYTLALCLLMVMVLAPAQQVQASPGGGWEILGQHTVKSGEHLYCIARAYGVDPHAIAVQNGIVCPNCLCPGKVLDIPNESKTLPAGPVCDRQFPVEDGENGEQECECCPTGSCQCCGGCACCPCTGCGWSGGCRARHVIRTGETLSGIAAWYGVNVWSLARYNGLCNPHYIRAGDMICIP